MKTILKTIELAHVTDPRGTCPSCRDARLRTEEMPFAGHGPRPEYHRAAHCLKCGYVYRLAADERIVGGPFFK